jgi:hypothetical protein
LNSVAEERAKEIVDYLVALARSKILEVEDSGDAHGADDVIKPCFLDELESETAETI